MASAAALPRLTLADVAPELIERILARLPAAHDLASANAASRIFRGAPGRASSPVERVLRERARARGHERALPATLTAASRTWIGELLAREHVLQLARAHAHVVACGGYSVFYVGFEAMSAFVDAEGGLHTCGAEERPGRPRRAPIALGHGHERLGPMHAPTRVASLCAVRVRAVAAGNHHHLLALSDAGAVYGCGLNHCGQLGLGDGKARSSFASIALPRGALVSGIAAAACHSLALTAAGCAYSWGYNGSGQLGHGDTETRWEPTRIEALDGVRVGGMSAGWCHTLLLSTDGDVYSCGYGYYGRLGHGDQQEQHTPRRIEALAGVRAVHVSAGNCHSLVVDARGRVSSFGQGVSGQLGYGSTRGQLLPTPIAALGSVRAVSACAGPDGSAVLGADGSVHTFGENRYAQLGRPASADASVPGRVELLGGQRVAACALSHSHALYVTADGRVHACGHGSAAVGRKVGPPPAASGEGDGARHAPMVRIAGLPRVPVRSDDGGCYLSG